MSSVYCDICGTVHPRHQVCPPHPGREEKPGKVIRMEDYESRFKGLLFAVWNELSTECQDDIMHSRPGSIVRCTRNDFELLAPIPLSERTIADFKEVAK